MSQEKPEIPKKLDLSEVRGLSHLDNETLAALLWLEEQTAIVGYFYSRAIAKLLIRLAKETP